MKIKITPRQELWPKRTYQTIYKDNKCKILRPVEFDLEQALTNLLRRKKKWE